MIFFIQACIKFNFRKESEKKVLEFNRLPLQSGFAGSPNFSKKSFFHIFQKLRAFKTFFNKFIFIIRNSITI